MNQKWMKTILLALNHKYQQVTNNTEDRYRQQILLPSITTLR